MTRVKDPSSVGYDSRLESIRFQVISETGVYGAVANRKRVQRVMALLGLPATELGPHSSWPHQQNLISPYLLWQMGWQAATWCGAWASPTSGPKGAPLEAADRLKRGLKVHGQLVDLELQLLNLIVPAVRLAGLAGGLTGGR
ncbi:MAG: hypothetical protein ABEJ96_08185, partial [Thiohalorhabdaceae bacterium]